MCHRCVLKGESILHSNKFVWSIGDGCKRITMTSIVIPTLVQLIFEQICGTINTIVLSGYSELAVSASGVANEVLNVGTVLIGMISTGTVIIISIKIGERNIEDAGEVTCTGAVGVLLFSLLIAVLEFCCAEFFMSAMNLRGETLALAVSYLRIKALFIPPVAFSSYFASILICNGYSKYTLIVGSIGSVLNLIVSYIAIYSSLTFMTPIARVALFSGFVSFFTMCMMLLIFLKLRCPFSIKFNGGMAIKIIKLGSAGVMMTFMWRMAQTVTTALVANMGDEIMNTKIYIGNIVFYVPLMCYAISTGHGIFMGRMKGSGDFKMQKRIYRQNISLALLCNFGMSIAVLILHRPLIGIFTDNEAIITASTVIFVLDIFVQIPRAVNNISERSLNANGDVKTTFITSTLSCWFGSVALGYFFCAVLDLGLVGMWLAFIADETFKSIVYTNRWRSEKWKEISV